MKYSFSFLIIVFILTLSCSVFENTSVQVFSRTIVVKDCLAQEKSQPLLEASKVLEKEAETSGKRILTGVLTWLKNTWQKISSFLKKINSFLSEEVEKRKPEIKEEFKKEKQEMKEDIPRVGKSIWQRFLELIRY